MRVFVAFTLCGALAACGDPLSGVNRLSDVELADGAPMVEVAAAPERNGGGMFSRLLGRSAAPEVTAEPSPETAPILSATDAAVGQALDVALEQTDGDPLASATPATPQVIDLTQVVLAEPEAPRRGLFGFLRRKDENTVQTAALLPETISLAETPDASPQASAEKVSALAAPADTPIASDPSVATTVDPAKTAEITADAPQATTRPRRGLFAMLGVARDKSDTVTETATVQTASLGGLFASPASSNKPSRALSADKHKGPDAQIVPTGMRIQSGSVARVCDFRKKDLGKQVAKFPERGSGYKLYDSIPGSAVPRPFYVTGFKDGCARTFTAALAIFGSPTLHEQLRYGLPSKVQPYSTTDQAYEGIKRSVCGVGKRKPCGAKVKLLEKDTVFISIYDRIGSNSKWSNILLHKGVLLAADRKG
jgi:hypothetical protein